MHTGSKLLQLQTESEKYWTDTFRVTDEDTEYLFSLFLEEETPLTSAEIARRIIKFRVDQEIQMLRRQMERGAIFQPQNSYSVGEQLIFPALGYTTGEVVGERPGNNPEYGPFTVIEVSFPSGSTREFASALQAPHASTDGAEGGDQVVSARHRHEAIFVIRRRYHLLVENGSRGKRRGLLRRSWFSNPCWDVSIVHCILAERARDVRRRPAEDGQIMARSICRVRSTRIADFSRSRVVQRSALDEGRPGRAGVRFMREMEPEEVISVQARLRYEPVDYNWRLLSDELAALEYEIDDELSNLRSPAKAADSVTFSLNFPHRRTGTLPLSSRLRHLFPTAYEAPRVLMTLIDGQTGEEMLGWVVREHKYVYGLADFYRRHKLPVGTYLTIRATDDPSRVVVDFTGYRPRTEWIRLAASVDDRLRFENQKRAIGAEYDELMVLGADDIKAVDALWIPAGPQAERRLNEVLRDLMSDLSRLTPQRSVHAKTLYSAGRCLRCRPAHFVRWSPPEFEHVGGPYWRLV